MGFVEKLRGELVDVVEWMDESRDTLVWRFPRYHNQLKNGARLVVRPGQSAVFVDQGRVADTFGPGTYELTTKILPLLSTLRGWKHGFESPFKAEIYFVATRQVTELKWGTPNPVLLRDPELGPLRVRAFGTYTLRATKPEALLAELVGTDGSFQAEEIDLLLRSIIATEFAALVSAAEIAVVDLASKYATLSEELRRRVLARVDDEYGLDIPQLYIVNVSVPEPVERAFDARSSMGVLGDMNRYQQYQLGSAIPAAAANPAGGLAAAGVGLGMGMAYAGGMTGVGAAGGPGTAGSRAPLLLIPPTPENDPTVWHVAAGGRTAGPFSVAQLGQGVAAGQLTRESVVWAPGMTAWAPLAQVPRLAILFAPPPPPAG
jgi:membrane protease subunit (stomatin/prohibitin family)